jgi:hypothetical protein
MPSQASSALFSYFVISSLQADPKTRYKFQKMAQILPKPVFCQGQWEFETKLKRGHGLLVMHFKSREFNIVSPNGTKYKFVVGHCLKQKPAEIHETLFLTAEQLGELRTTWTWSLHRKKDDSIIQQKQFKMDEFDIFDNFFNPMDCGTVQKSDWSKTVIIKMTILVHEDLELPKASVPPVPPSWTNIIKEMFNNDKLSDIKIICESEIFLCQKFVLSTRSDVFRTMFESNDFSENTKNVVEIDDIDIVTKKAFLTFLYTYELLKHEIDYSKLIIVADKYNVMDLYQICQNQLVKSVNLDNVVQLLFLGYLLNNSKLMKVSTDFAGKNGGKVKKCDDWIEIQKVHPDIASKLLDAVVFTTE